VTPGKTAFIKWQVNLAIHGDIINRACKCPQRPILIHSIKIHVHILSPLGINGSDAIRALLNDAELRKRMSKAGRERVIRDFKPEDIWEALYQEYVRLLKEKGIPAPLPESR
jgi:hypothetical protein